jgi:hypothetical protein
MRVLVGCEYSGTVRDAFIRAGYDAMSCDLLPTESKGPHYQGDIFDVIDDGWDLGIFHPPCTFMCNSGVRWLYNKDGSKNEDRWTSMYEAAVFFRKLHRCKKIKHLGMENPIMHRYAKAVIDCDPTQIIQPWQFGHGETKATCLWLKNLPTLAPTNIVSGRHPKVHLASPGEDRWKIRSLTYAGIAEAMADQWGSHVSKLLNQ